MTFSKLNANLYRVSIHKLSQPQIMCSIQIKRQKLENLKLYKITNHASVNVVDSIDSSGPEHINSSEESEPYTYNSGCSLSQ